MNNNSSTFATRRSNTTSSWGRNQNIVRHKSASRLGPISHTIFLAVAVTILGLIYLTQAAKVTNYDYEAQRVDTQIAELEQQRADLAVENARLTALSTTSSSEVAANMVEPEETRYIGQ